MAVENPIEVLRDYSDNFAIKDHVVSDLIPEYFSDVDVSVRTIGTIAFMTEQISNISEDAFNTASVLFREAFANRAQIDESIYSHAAIFQIDDVFSNAAACKMLIVLDEGQVQKNMIEDTVSGYTKYNGVYHFYLGRDTFIYIEEKPYVLDYPVRFDIIKKISDSGRTEYLYSAKYIMPAPEEDTGTRSVKIRAYGDKTDNTGIYHEVYKNSISDLSDPYVKVRRSADGYIAIEVMTHQCYRDVHYEQIVTNNVINYPIIDIPFEGQLAGFDVLYREPSSYNFDIQMDKQIVYTQPSKHEFCYFQLLNEHTVRITFNTKDNYYSPDYNSEIKVIFYITEGSEGNFKSYDGKNIELVPDSEEYSYNYQYLITAKPIGASMGGRNKTSLDALQDYAVEGYRTALALTTENDLLEYFNNYRTRFGDSYILFIRKRDDVYERVFSAYMIMKDNKYIYNTNTLNLDLNISEMVNSEENIWMLDPGWLFTANEPDGFAQFYRDPEKTNQYYEEYLEAINNGTIPFISEENDQESIPAYLDRPASFAEFKVRRGLEDKVSIFDIMENDNAEDYLVLDDPSENKFLLVNPFLMKFKKNPNLVSVYMTCINDSYTVDFKDINDDSFVQFILYTMNVERKFERAKRYTFTINIAPSIGIDEEHPLIQADTYDEYGNIASFKLNDPYSVEDNDLRVFVVLENNGADSCYIELYPSDYDSQNNNFTFKCEIFTDDHVTSAGKIRIMDGAIYRNKETGHYYKMHTDDNTLYDEYDENNEIVNTDILVDHVTQMLHDGILYKYCVAHNMTTSTDILVPMVDVEFRVYTLYNRYYSEEEGALVLNPPERTNNIFYELDPEGLEGYVWTNEYTTGVEPLVLLKPLDEVRVNISFKDYTIARKITDEDGVEKIQFDYDILDMVMKSIPMMRWNICLDDYKMNYFMTTFFEQYNNLTWIIQNRLRNVTAIDMKFYNTYGRSKNYYIGENREIINTVNLEISFDIWYVPGTEMAPSTTQIKEYIKDYIETINENGQNNLFISNLMRKIEEDFGYVDHIRFGHINSYSTDYQAVKNFTADLTTLTVDQRRNYVPEFLVCNVEDIEINEFYSDEQN